MAKTKKELDIENANLRQKILDLENEMFKFKNDDNVAENLPDFTVGVFKMGSKFHLAKIFFNGETKNAKISEVIKVKGANGESMAVAENEKEQLIIEYQIKRRD